ncbi:MAG: S49 family peptidase [Proteobacteria bacterium]|nr:S49 family peptidase [Pseudomonadota bacterium]
MRYPLIATQLYGQPLLLQPEKAAIIESVFRAHALGTTVPVDAQTAQQDAAGMALRPAAGKPYALTPAGVAVIPITGTLVHRGSQLDSASGLTSYTALENMVSTAAGDADVKGILLEVDSPGGQAAGVFDLGEKIRALAKPVWASVNEMALSGGYVLAAAADKVMITKSARVGSIGVIALHVDQSQKNAKTGYRYTAIHAGAKKNDGTPHAPLSDSARGDMQSMVDGLYVHFVDYVAQMRGLNPVAVRSTEAGVVSGQAAIDAGLADGIMSFNDTLAAFEAVVSKPAGISNGGIFRSLQGVAKMSDSAQATAAENYTAAETASLLAEAKTEGASGMQERIKTIQTCDEAKGRSALAAHLAFNTTMAAPEAIALLAVSAQEVSTQADAAVANPLVAGMAAVTNPNVGADTAAVTAGDTHVATVASWDRAFNKTPLRAVK